MRDWAIKFQLEAKHVLPRVWRGTVTVIATSRSLISRITRQIAGLRMHILRRNERFADLSIVSVHRAALSAFQGPNDAEFIAERGCERKRDAFDAEVDC